MRTHEAHQSWLCYGSRACIYGSSFLGGLGIRCQLTLLCSPHQEDREPMLSPSMMYSASSCCLLRSTLLRIVFTYTFQLSFLPIGLHWSLPNQLGLLCVTKLKNISMYFLPMSLSQRGKGRKCGSLPL